MPLKFQWDTYGIPAPALTDLGMIISITKIRTENWCHCKNIMERSDFVSWVKISSIVLPGIIWEIIQFGVFGAIFSTTITCCWNVLELMENLLRMLNAPQHLSLQPQD